MAVSKSNLTRRLGTALVTWSTLLAVGGVYCLFAWLTHPSQEAARPLAPAAELLLAGGLAYLILATVVGVRLGTALRHGCVPGRSGLAVLMAGHLVVLLVAGRTLWVGVQSNTLLTGLAPLAATLATAGTLSLGLLSAVWLIGARKENPAADGTLTASAGPPSVQLAWPWWVLHGALCAAVVGSLVYLEGLPPRGSSPAVPAYNAAQTDRNSQGAKGS